MSQIIFWISLVLIVYVYAGFPLLLLLRSWLVPRPYRQASLAVPVSIIVAAHNEEQTIGAKLENILSLNYPANLLEVLIASDGSTDKTNQVVSQFASRGVKLLALPRAGKAAALNAAVSQARGDIVVFSDANSMFAGDALRELLRPLADERVGGVAGNQCYLKDHFGSSGTAGERSYWNLDRWTKLLQSRAGSVTSATGAIYAIRKRLFLEVAEDVTDDFATSTAVIVQGYRLVFAPDAIVYEPVAPSGTREFVRKVRVITRGLRAVMLRRCLLDPRRYGFYSLQLFSHKVLRRLIVFPILAMLLVSPWLWQQEGAVYRVAIGVQAALYACAIAGAVFGRFGWRQPKCFSLPLFLCLVNAAALVAAWNIVCGRKVITWVPQRDNLSTSCGS